MSVAGLRLNKFIENLNQLCSHHPRLISHIIDNIDALKHELSYLQSVMGDFLRVGRDHSESSYFKCTSMEIIEVIDEAEDAVDTYLVLAAGQRSKSWWMSISLHPKELKSARKKIANMSDQVKQITQKNMQLLALVPHVSRSGMSSYQQVTKVEEDHVVGFENPAKTVLKLLTGGPENLEVIAIVGTSGLGKTTLARKVYKDPEVKYYMIRAFVYVSDTYDKRDVLLQILGSCTRPNQEVIEMSKEQLEKMRVEELEKHVCKQLEGKQYLIVLDDVWDTEDWDAFKGAFPHNEKQRCKVLITTPNVGMPEYANATNPHSLYMMDSLTVEDSEELLQCKVFAQDKFPAEIKQYRHEIAKQCKGLPLAILLVAGVLWDHRDKVTWWKELSSILSTAAALWNIIEMMYEHLPNNLKPCFIYLGVFPECYKIPVWKLVRLWISEGFIDGKENPEMELEDIAELYLEQLVQRNLVMDVRRRSNGKMKTCRLHNTLFKFCKREAGQGNFFQKINGHKLNLNLSADSTLDYRRICISGPIMLECFYGSVSCKHVRSFLSFQKEVLIQEAKHASVIPDTFKLLKVLEAHSLHLPSFWTDLSRLVLLKYLAVSTESSSIPSAFSGLWSLQTLIVGTTSQSLKVEMDLWKMPHFRHFHTDSTATFPTPDTKTQKIEASDVRTLRTISTESCSRKFLDATPRLKKLGIRGNLAKFFQSIGDSESDGTSKSKLGELQDLENLKLINGEETLKLQSLPSHTCFPPRLTMLTLTNTRLEWKGVSTLGRLENLEVLKLKDFAFQGSSWKTEDPGFVRLVHLFIGQTDLVSWETRAVHFPRLKTLKLNGCNKLEALPRGLLDISSLQLVVLHNTNPTVTASTREKFEQARRKGDKKYNLKLSVYPPRRQ